MINDLKAPCISGFCAADTAHANIDADTDAASTRKHFGVRYCHTGMAGTSSRSDGYDCSTGSISAVSTPIKRVRAVLNYAQYCSSNTINSMLGSMELNWEHLCIHDVGLGPGSSSQ